MGVSVRTRPAAVFHLVASSVVGLGVFAVPLPVGGRWTVLFDVAVKAVTRGAPGVVSAYCVALAVVGAALTLRAPPGTLFHTGPALRLARVSGAGLAVVMASGVGPAWLLSDAVRGLMWSTLVASVAVIIPTGAAVLHVLVSYGLLELVGGWMRPLMRPVFRLPGRAALDDLMSWLGSYSVGLYVTRKLTDQGRYTRREAAIIVTGFSTVSIGFVGVVCSTLDLLHLFPVVFGTYFVVVYLLAAILARTWPITSIPDVTVAGGPPAAEPATPPWEQAMARATEAPGVLEVLREGFVDGLALAATLVGTILAVGTLALAAEDTGLFDRLGAPLVPVLSALGLPDAEILAPAVLAGITEMYIPALLARDAAVEGRFFIAVLSISQLIFFSSVAPMMLDMFRDLPLRVHHLLGLFVMRTVLLVPLLAAVVAALGWLGVFAS